MQKNTLTVWGNDQVIKKAFRQVADGAIGTMFKGY